uniref:Aromatic-L-amino-acid decarboxylase n=1 Tax=Angiostrongylus cantonensis TaxID=6313 RepID=A0A0K0CYD2_ANGCA
MLSNLISLIIYRRGRGCTIFFMYDGKSVEMFFCAWFLIIAWTHVVAEKAEKELKLFFNNAEDFTTVKKLLLPLSDRFTTIIHSTDITENTVCTEFPFDIVNESGQTALIVLPSIDDDPPSCFSQSEGGNIVYAVVGPNDVKHGNLKEEISDLHVGDIEDLVEYLDDITTEQDLVHEVSDTYTGVKEHVSLLDPIYVPLWLVILIAILLILSILITLIIQCREPTAKDSQRVNPVKKTDSISESPGRCSTTSEPQSMSASHKYVTSSEKKRRLKRSLPAVDPESKGKEDEFPAKQRGVNELIKEPVTSTEFELYLNRLARFVIQYYDKPTIYDVTPDVKRGFLYNKLPKNCPQNPDAFKAIFDDFKNQVVPGLTHWQHPFFFAYYPIGRCYPDVLADFITSAISAIGFSWDSCPALTEVEHAIVNWVGRAFGIPESFLFQDCPESSQGGGTLTESGSDAIFCALLAARQWKINQVAEQQQRTGVEKYATIHDIAKRLVVYCSKDAHFSTEKGCRLAMLRCRAIQPLEENQWGLTGEQIQMEIEKVDIEKGLIPCFISCTLGTTTTASSDKLTSIVPVAKKYDTWLHVDADYAGSAFIVQKNREVA